MGRRRRSAGPKGSAPYVRQSVLGERYCPRPRFPAARRAGAKNRITKRIAGVETSAGVEPVVLGSDLRGADSPAGGSSGGHVFGTGMLEAMTR
jgi:hypothetical protein